MEFTLIELGTGLKVVNVIQQLANNIMKLLSHQLFVKILTLNPFQRKRKVLALKKQRTEKNKVQAAEYAKLIAQRLREKRQALLSRRRSSNRTSTSSA